ncbi:hypothetical protein F4678DRAFT_459808 [Xylaria arbuscula]|nr:hypothetical protein F4678DRAFT_459808 [Xylaria arbuscula]
MSAAEASESISKLSIDSKLSINSLDTSHIQIFGRALRNVLSSDAAELTYGQIVDGFPIASVDEDNLGGTISFLHPIHTKHTELCPGVLERLRKIQDTSDITSLQFDSKLVYAYNNTLLGSREFETRLIEMTAVVVHQIAVQLFKSETSLHENDDDMVNWKDDDDEDCVGLGVEVTMPPTLFRHLYYCDYEQYPDGIAGGVGYWAENRIFGGVILFDRRAPGSSPNLNNPLEVDPNAIYFHSSRRMTTGRIYQLLPNQRSALVKYLLSETTPPAECPFPLLATKANIKRIDTEERIVDTGVYRDTWERKDLGMEDFYRDLDNRVYSVVDFPTDEDAHDEMRRMSMRKARVYHAWREESLKEKAKREAAV